MTTPLPLTDKKQRVGLFNPWDSDSYVSSDAVYSDVSYTCNLYKYPSWAGLSSVNPSTIPTSTMTSIGDIAYAIPTPHITAPTTTQKGVADPFEKVVWETVVVTVAV